MHLKELDANLLVVLDALLIDASVSKAAERLGRSPSAVSHALANLRTIFADDLFVRAGQRLVPTTKATELAPTIHIIVSGMESLLRPSMPFDPRAQERGFTVACREACELTLLHELRQALRADAPGIEIEWRSLEGARSLDELRMGRTQFILVEGAPEEDAADFIWKHLYDEPYVTLAGTGNPLTKKRPSTRAFFAAEHILIAPPYGAPDLVGEHFGGLGVSPENATYASSVFIGLFLALESEGLVTVPKSVADAVMGRMALKPVIQPVTPLVIPNHLGWHRSQDRDECHEWVRAQLMELGRAKDAAADGKG